MCDIVHTQYLAYVHTKYVFGIMIDSNVLLIDAFKLAVETTSRSQSGRACQSHYISMSIDSVTLYHSRQYNKQIRVKLCPRQSAHSRAQAPDHECAMGTLLKHLDICIQYRQHISINRSINFIAIFSLVCIMFRKNLSKLCHISTYMPHNRGYMPHMCGYMT